MKCVRCGYCCVNYLVTIVVDPRLGTSKDNLRLKNVGEVCPHLSGNTPGKLACLVHEEPWYCETVCFDFGQVEMQSSDCRIGLRELSLCT